MIKQKLIKSYLPHEIYVVFQELNVLRHLKQAGIAKQKGVNTAIVFTFLFSLAFKNRSIFQLTSGRDSENYPKKDVVYRFMNHESFNWEKFLLSLSTFVIAKVDTLTSKSKHVRVLIVDDSSFYRGRSKKVDKLAWLYDHALQRNYKGFRMLTLGFSDGFSFVPIAFELLSGKKKVEELSSFDKRTCVGKRKMRSDQAAPELVVEMVKKALDNGVFATHVLMDKWFTYPKLITQLSSLGIEVIGMVKNSNTRYIYQGNRLTIAELYKIARKEQGKGDILSSIQAKLSSGIAVKIVFVRNKNKKSQWLAIMTTDTTMSSKEIVKTYGVRWDIEVFFKANKSLLKLAKETQTRNYQGLICHTTVVFTRYIVLSWQQRCATDARTFGGFFYELCDEMQELDWATALFELTQILLDVTEKAGTRLSKWIHTHVYQWFLNLPNYIRIYLPQIDELCQAR
jgi:hypothetical protein